MTGKVFAESMDIWDDQAKVVFDYLSQAALKIVTEEERIEKEIQIRKESIEQEIARQPKLKTLSIALLVGGGLTLILITINMLFIAVALGLLIAGFRKLSEKNKSVAQQKSLEEQIATFESEHKNIRRDYQIHKLGVAYIPVASRVPFEDGHILLDHTGAAPRNQFSLQTVRDQDNFIRNIQALDKALDRMPAVESAEYIEEVDTSDYSKSVQSVPYFDYLGDIDRNMRSASFALSDLENTTVELPTVDPQSEFSAYLAAHGTSQIGKATVLSPFALDAHREDLEKFTALNNMRKSMEGQTAQFEEYLQRLMEQLASAIQIIAKTKTASTNALTDYGNAILFNSLKASYNHYSPQLEAEEIERIRNERFDYQESVETYKPFELKQGSRVQFDLFSGNWVSEDGRRTSFPFGVHQIHEEIVAPIVQNLMTETRIERLKIYNGIKDQKLDYLNQWHRDTDDFYGRNRSEGNNLINLMQASLTDFIAAYNQFESFEKTRNSMRNGTSAGNVTASEIDADSILVYKTKMEQFRKQQEEFNEFADRLKEEIDSKAEEFGYIEYYDASLRDSHTKEFAMAQESADQLDSRRKTLLGVNALVASKADLPPIPDMESVIFDTIGMDLLSHARSTLQEAISESAIIHPPEPISATNASVDKPSVESTSDEYYSQSTTEDNTDTSTFEDIENRDDEEDNKELEIEADDDDEGDDEGDDDIDCVDDVDEDEDDDDLPPPPSSNNR